jgi:signal transduction histidine kinase
MGFSRKIGGRGMGLFISREILKTEGFKLTLEDYHQNEGASFIIEPIQDQYSESREQE